jgi:branched-chain amino acid transport system ATP-binding protein
LLVLAEGHGSRNPKEVMCSPEVGMLSGRGGRGVSDEIALKVDTLDVHYKDFQALWNVSLAVRAGKIISVIGANGSGKSTMLNTVAGLLRPSRGTITYSGQRIDGRPAYEVLALGISLVPEGRRVFARLTVYENLVMGSFLPKSRSRKEAALGKLYELFPILQTRWNQMANTLSGGEQQMLAIARALMSGPSLCAMRFSDGSLHHQDIYKG